MKKLKTAAAAKCGRQAPTASAMSRGNSIPAIFIVAA